MMFSKILYIFSEHVLKYTCSKQFLSPYQCTSSRRSLEQQSQAFCTTFVIIRANDVCSLHTLNCGLLCSTPSVCDRLRHPVHVRRVHSLSLWKQVNRAQGSEKKKKKKKQSWVYRHKGRKEFACRAPVCLGAGFISICQRRKTDDHLYSKMPHALRSPASCAKMQTTLSAWTPLNHPLSNSKVFEERRILLTKWFDRWTDSQRRAVLQDFVLSCSSEQLMFLSCIVSRRLPLQAADFTCLLPRALCLYLFSFLDPRSLCRCAQVSWHWKSIVELDQLWMPKCLRLGWCIGFSPTAFEQGVWKRHYIQTVQELRLTSVQSTSSRQQFVVPNVSVICSRHEDVSEVALGEERPTSNALPLGGTSRKKQQTALRPWRAADRCPKDTLRFNYLDNLEPAEEALKGKMNIRASTCCSDSWKPDAGSRKTLSEAHYKLRKAKSLMFLSSNCRAQHPPPPPPAHHHHEAQTRPSWTTWSHDHHVTMETAHSMLRMAKWNAGVRPGPMKSPVPQLSVEALRASRRSNRSAPSIPLFEVQTCTVPASHA